MQNDVCNIYIVNTYRNICRQNDVGNKYMKTWTKTVARDKPQAAIPVQSQDQPVKSAFREELTQAHSRLQRPRSQTQLSPVSCRVTTTFPFTIKLICFYFVEEKALNKYCFSGSPKTTYATILTGGCFHGHCISVDLEPITKTAMSCQPMAVWKRRG